jgi:AcrR family transcriptional regulator
MQTSIRDIARRGSVTTGAIYSQFRNKADLLVEAINARTAEELEDRAIAPDREVSHVETLARLAAQYPTRRRLRTLIVQGAAAAQTDEEMRQRLRDAQLIHLNSWIQGYEANRERLGIDPSVDLQAAVLYTWAVEVGLGVLEAVGILPKSRKGWADMASRFGRSLLLPPAGGVETALAKKTARLGKTGTRSR